MRITYIEHSSFCVETDRAYLLFDYYEGSIPEFIQDKLVMVFVSHRHYDHYNSKIFDLADRPGNIVYFLSKDIESSISQKDITHKWKDTIIFLEEHQVLDSKMNDINFTIETLSSNDEGVAFIVSIDNKCIYHGGDLNWWYWEGESDAYNKDLVERYQSEIKKIQGRSFDAAFIPLDHRLGEHFYKGFDYFMRLTKTKNAFPMHFFKNYSVVQKILDKECAKDYSNRIRRIHNSGQVFHI